MWELYAVYNEPGYGCVSYAVQRESGWLWLCMLYAVQRESGSLCMSCTLFRMSLVMVVHRMLCSVKLVLSV